MLSPRRLKGSIRILPAACSQWSGSVGMSFRSSAAPFSGARLEGYEIHMGQTRRTGEQFCTPENGRTMTPFCVLEDGRTGGAAQGNVFGTYLHGLFDSGELTQKLAAWLLSRKGLTAEHFPVESHRSFQERQFDMLAKEVRSSLDIAAVYRAMERFSG